MRYIVKDLRLTKQLGKDIWFNSSFGNITDNLKDAGIYTEDDKNTIWSKNTKKNPIEFVELTPEIVDKMKVLIQEKAEEQKEKLDELVAEQREVTAEADVINEYREKLTAELERFFGFGSKEGAIWYVLARTKKAFDDGTMEVADFEEVTHDDVEDLVDELLKVTVRNVDKSTGLKSKSVWSQISNASNMLITEFLKFRNGNVNVVQSLEDGKASSFMCFTPEMLKTMLEAEETEGKGIK